MIADSQVKDILTELQTRLAGKGETVSMDVQVLLAHVLGKSRAWVLAHPEATLSPEQETYLSNAFQQLERGTPLPYILGRWEFFSLEFILTPSVLIPRPETEVLVDKALFWLQANPGRRYAADVGTGSGCIAVSLAVHTPDLFTVASDLSFPALRTAYLNACKHGVAKRVHFLQADLLPPTRRPFDLICANLPYVPSTTLRSLPVFGKEPQVALDGGLDGLDFVRRLVKIAPGYLSPGGLILLEIEASQGSAALFLAEAALPGADVTICPDLAGQDRLLSILCHDHSL